MTLVQRIRVPAGLAFGILLFVFAQPRPDLFWLGMPLAAAGASIRLWASGHLDKWRGLARSGPYQLTRNPLYLGSFLAGLGLTVAAAELWLLLAYLVLFPGIYWPVVLREEREMLSHYGSDYAAYAATVPRFCPLRFPGPTGAGSGTATRFQWKLFLRNREYRFLISVVLAGIIFVWKMG